MIQMQPLVLKEARIHTTNNSKHTMEDSSNNNNSTLDMISMDNTTLEIITSSTPHTMAMVLVLDNTHNIPGQSMRMAHIRKQGTTKQEHMTKEEWHPQDLDHRWSVPRVQSPT
jgi:hypothetical protein